MRWAWALAVGWYKSEMRDREHEDSMIGSLGQWTLSGMKITNTTDRRFNGFKQGSLSKIQIEIADRNLQGFRLAVCQSMREAYTGKLFISLGRSRVLVVNNL